MNRKIKIGISILLIIVMLSIHVSYAISGQKEFFKVNKEEISPEETLEMTFDIANIEYNQFKILLSSSVNPNEIYTKDEENLTLENIDNAISIDVDKEKINLNQITLYYHIPKETQIGSKIQFTAKVITNNETEEVVKEDTKVITIVEKSEDKNKPNEENTPKEDNQGESGEQNRENNKPNNSQEIPSREQSNNSMLSQNSKSNTNNQKMSISGNVNFGSSSFGTKTENQDIYNGSNNNYLSSLEVERIELNTSFNKEKGTYFINTNNTNSLNVIATAEDSTAKVCIVGNDNIQSGNNKILISVTAENGNIRYYRIFVNCE